MMKPLCLILLLLPLVLGQTKVKPEQVRNWTQLKHAGGGGTQLSIRQLQLGSPYATASWEAVATRSTYPAQYRVAIVPTQRLPILITCYERTSECNARASRVYPLWFNQPNTF